jgi:hypothetical protein
MYAIIAGKRGSRLIKIKCDDIKIKNDTNIIEIKEQLA